MMKGLSVIGSLIILTTCVKAQVLKVNTVTGIINPCQFTITYDNKEYDVNGVTNYFVGISGFDTTSQDCWNGLAEFYFNIVPDTSTKTQNSYFFLENDSIPYEVKSVNDFSKPDFDKARVIALHQYGDGIDSFKVVYYPLKTPK